MLQPALRISENEILLLSSIVTISFSRRGERTLLFLELCNHKSLTFTDQEAEAMYEKLSQRLEVT